MENQKDNDEGSENIEDSISSEENSNDSNNNILFNIDIKLSDTKTAKLYINENDDIDEKINYFCEAYKIKPQLRPLIKKIVENKLNQELSAQKNSSTTSSSKQIINNDNKDKKNEIFQSFNKEACVHNLKEEKKLEYIERESETTFERIEPKDNQINKNKKRIVQNNQILIENKKKMYNNSSNETINNENLNINNNKSKDNSKIYKTYTVKNQLNNKNNIINSNRIINSNYINNNKIVINNKRNYKPKKINIIKMKNKQLIKKRPNSTGNNKNIKNEEFGGVRLYNNYINSSPKKNLALQEKYREKDKQYLRFTPEINKNSRRIYEKNKYLTNNQKVEDRLIDYGNKLNQKILTEKTNILLKDIKDNTFTPHIDNFSRYIADNMKPERINKLAKMGNILIVNNNNNNKNKSKNKKVISLNKNIEKRNKSLGDKDSKNEISTFISFGKNNNIFKEGRQSYILTETERDSLSPYNPDKSIFDCLYLESKLNRINKQNKINNQLKDRYTFRPTISPLAKELKKENKETQQQFIDRLSSLQKKHKKDLKIKEENEKNNFRPKITRGPKNVRQREIKENLNGYYDKRMIKQKEILENNEIKNNIEKKNYYIQKSSELIMKMKYEKYKLLFEFLDSDKDGLISCDKIKLTGINNDLLNTIKPFLDELNETKKNIDLKNFCNKIHHLFSKQNVKDIINLP